MKPSEMPTGQQTGLTLAVSKLGIAEALIREVLDSGTLDLKEVHCQVCNVTRKVSLAQYKVNNELGAVVNKLQKLSTLLREELEEGTDGHQRGGTADR